MKDMIKKIKFKPAIKTLGFYCPSRVFDFKELRDEAMFFSCSPSYIGESGNYAPITRLLIDRVLSRITEGHIINLGADKQFVVDTRVNMLMRGQYPSIPGWHCDDVPRDKKYAQPDFNLCDEDTQHFLVIISDTKDPANCISGTEFITNAREYNLDKNNIYGSLNTEVQKDESKDTRFVREREIVQFNQAAIHRASPAKTSGWRYFFRLSYTHRKPVNEIRNQTQIYVNPDDAGW